MCYNKKTSVSKLIGNTPTTILKLCIRKSVPPNSILKKLSTINWICCCLLQVWSVAPYIHFLPEKKHPWHSRIPSSSCQANMWIPNSFGFPWCPPSQMHRMSRFWSCHIAQGNLQIIPDIFTILTSKSDFFLCLIRGMWGFQMSHTNLVFRDPMFFVGLL